ncbi:MAG: hypothetical protein GX616_17655 [Planctomycetes bacterium]|nr:hypothetical protein [Planctomycetota bacterium]
MATHWTYEAIDPGNDLFQGDILEPTQDLREILREVHPHFRDPKYTAFMVITQSCDMALRKGRCSTKYLSIAVVRPIEAILHDLLDDVCRPVVGGVYLQESKGEARRLFVRLFNQNEQRLGLFYLHPDVEVGIAEPSVALLRVAVALRVDHYAVLRDARRGSLCNEFRSKLGWLVGNLYSRIGTQDWNEPPERQAGLDELLKQCLDPTDNSLGPVWVPQTWVSAAKEKGIQVEEIDRAELPRVLEAHRPPAAKTRIIEQVLRVAKDVLPGIEEDALRRLCSRLENDSLFSKAVRSAKSE